MWQPKGIHSFSVKNKETACAETAGGKTVYETKIVAQTDFVTFHFMEMRFHFRSSPLSRCCWLSLTLRRPPDSSNCHFALVPTSDALTSGRVSLSLATLPSRSRSVTLSALLSFTYLA